MPSVMMDFANYGVPVDPPYRYGVTLDLALRFDDNGNVVRSAPFSMAGKVNCNVGRGVDNGHGCINFSPTNARWFFYDFGPDDPVWRAGQWAPQLRGERLAEGEIGGDGADFASANDGGQRKGGFEHG